MELVVEDFIVFLLGFEYAVVVFRWTHHVLILHHHVSGLGHQSFFQGLGIGDHEPQDTLESVDEEERPAHCTDVTWIKVHKSYSLLGHRLELSPERERHFGDNETAENGTNSVENSDIKNALNVLLEHVAHHVWVRHHGSHLVELHLLLEVSCLGSAEIGFSLFESLLW